MRSVVLVAVAAALVGIAVLSSSADTASAEVAGEECASPPQLIGSVLASLSADGTTLTVSPKFANGRNCQFIEYQYDWGRRGASGVFFPIADDANEAQVSRTAAEDGLIVRAEVTATNEAGSSGGISNEVPIPYTAPPTCSAAPPTNTIAPSLWHDDEDSVLSAVEGSWASCVSAIAGYTYTWRRNGTQIAGQVTDSYELGPGDLGQTIVVRVTAHNKSGESVAATSSAYTPSTLATEPQVVLGDPPATTDTTTFCFGALEDGPCGESAPQPQSLPSPEPVHNFGGKILERLQTPDILGIRSAIRTPRRNHFHLPYGVAAAMRVSAELGRTHHIQTGFARTDLYVVRCDLPAGWNKNRLYTYWETRRPGMTAAGHVTLCLFMDEVALGKSNLYTVFRMARSATIDNDQTWEARINGRRVTRDFLKMEAAAKGIAGGEIVQKQYPATFYPDGHVNGCYGCSSTPKGRVYWQQTKVAGSTQWTDIGVNDARNITAPDYRSDNRWQIGDLPRAFRVLHRCDTAHRYGC